MYQEDAHTAEVRALAREIVIVWRSENDHTRQRQDVCTFVLAYYKENNLGG